MPERDSTWLLSIGFDLIRWHDSQETVHDLYPKAGYAPPYEGTHAFTGESFLTDPGLIMESGTFGLPVVDFSIPLAMNVTFRSGRLQQFSLFSDDESSAARADDETLMTYALTLCRLLGAHTADDGGDERWTIDAVTLELEVDADGLRIRVERVPN